MLIYYIYNMKKLFCFFVCFVSIFCLIGCCNTKNIFYEASFIKEQMIVEYKENFKILQLADIQVENIQQVTDAFFDIDKLVESTQPNFIILSGDNVIPDNESSFDFFIDKMENYEIPWSYVFGNHDDEGVLSKTEIALKLTKAKHCLFECGPENISGIGNFYVNLCGKAGNVRKTIFFFDSNKYRNYNGVDGYDYIYKNQIEWYENQVKNIKSSNGGKVVDSLCFFHIPLPEYDTAIKQYQLGQIEGEGVFRENVCCPLENTNLFDKMQELKSTKAVFCGHDHINAGYVSYEGIMLSYGLKSAKTSYYDDDMLGGCLITINNDNIKQKLVYFE